jgi:hypothetical protein
MQPVCQPLAQLLELMHTLTHHQQHLQASSQQPSNTVSTQPASSAPCMPSRQTLRSQHQQHLQASMKSQITMGQNILQTLPVYVGLLQTAPSSTCRHQHNSPATRSAHKF